MLKSTVELDRASYLWQTRYFQDLLPLHGWWTNPDRLQDSSDIQVVYLPALLPREAQLAADKPDDVPLPYSFDAFGRYVQWFQFYHNKSAHVRRV